MGKKSFDTTSFGEGLFEGVVGIIDKQAEEKKRELDLQRDITKHVLMKKADMEMQKNWLEDMKGQIEGQQQGFVRDTQTPVTGMAKIFGPGQAPSQARPTPYAMTEETPTGRQPMMEQDVDYGALGQAQSVTATPTGASLRPMGVQDKMLNAYNALKKIEESGRPLNAQQQYLKKGLERKLFSAGMERADKPMPQSHRAIVGSIRAAKAKGKSTADIEKYIRYKGYEPEEFADELDAPGYGTPPPASMVDNIKNFVTATGTQKVSQVVNYIMQKFNTSRDKAIEIIRSMQGAS